MLIISYNSDLTFNVDFLGYDDIREGYWLKEYNKINYDYCCHNRYYFMSIIMSY